MAQWVKNSTAVAGVAVDVQVGSQARHGGLKDLSCGSDSVPGLGISTCYGCGHFKKIVHFASDKLV